MVQCVGVLCPGAPEGSTGSGSDFLFLFVKRPHSCLNIMSLVAVEKRKSGKNRKDRKTLKRLRR